MKSLFFWFVFVLLNGSWGFRTADHSRCRI